MIKKRENTSHSLRNRWILVVAVIVLVGIGVYNCMHAHKYDIRMKLVGMWNIEADSFYMERKEPYEFTNIVIEVKNDFSIKMPIIHDTISMYDIPEDKFVEELDPYAQKIVERWRKNFEKRVKDATGTWEIISTNPDSVFFNVPDHPLHGKYAIRFFIDENGYRGSDNIYKIELQNDSTYLICNKGLFIQEWERNNWESK